jgi:hypothetical protein
MIGAYYSSFRELSCCNEVLYSFRQHYINNPIIFINNGGDSKLEHIVRRYKCKYYYEEHNISNNNIANIIKQIKRLLSYIQLINTEWLLFLTDDILILNSISNYKNILCDINSNNNACLSGAILRTSFFKKLALQITKVESDIMKFIDTKPQNLNFDNVMSYLVNINDGTIGKYDGYNDMSSISDLKTRYKDNSITTLSNYKILYHFPIHPNLTRFIANKYTIVIFNNDIENILKYIDVKEVHEFIIIGNKNVNNKDVNNDVFKDVNIVYYDKDFICDISQNKLCDKNISDKMIKKLIPLAICKYIKTEHYIVIDDDYILTKPLLYKDFYQNNRLLYNAKSWKNIPDEHATWMASLQVRNMNSFTNQNFIHPYNLLLQNTLFINGPQILCTNIVYQLLYSVDKNLENNIDKKTTYNWKETILSLGASTYELYWIFMMETLRCNYYIASDNFVI